MTSFIKTNKLVEDIKVQYKEHQIKEISVIFNTQRVHSSEFGRYVRPVCLIVEFEDDTKKERLENPDYFFNIPQSLNYIIDMIKEQYAAILINPNDPRLYKENVIYYNKALAVIRNPKLIDELKEVENKSIQIIEYAF